MASFKFVYIPADLNDPIQERSLDVPEGKDVECALDAFKSHFKKAGGSHRDESKREAQRQMLLKQLGDAADNIDPAMLDGAIDMQMVENIALLSNSSETGFVGVNMYTDDQAQLKGLETNLRASQMAQCAGKMIEVKGDAFVARVFDNEEDFKRMDFTLQEVSSSAEWVKKAADIAKRKHREDGGLGYQQDFLDKMNKKKSSSSSHSPAVPPSVQVLELSPAEVAKDEGNAAFKKGEWQAAIDRYSAALQMDPELLPALNNRALAFLKLGQYELAEGDCTSVLQREPCNVKALLRRATAREQRGAREEALGDVEEVIRLEAGNKEAEAQRRRLTSARE